MSEPEKDLPGLSGWRNGAAVALIFAVALSGFASAKLWPLSIAGAVALLWISDRGQHRALVDRFERVGRGYIAALSVGSHLLNNVFFCALAFGVGRLSRLFWFDMFDGREGVWVDLAAWSAFELSLIVVMELLWWMLGNKGKHGRWRP